jgi:AraC-like DNA-binding protein
LIQMRLDEAERLLASPSADTAVLEEIATSVGFKSSSAFRLAFKERTGMTPGQYRRERGGAFEL